MYRRFRQSLLSVVLLVVAACGGSSRQNSETGQRVRLTAEEVLATYDLYRSGRYSEYVARMASCEGKPAEYLRQMTVALKQHAAERKHANGNVCSAEVSRLQISEKNSSATAFVNVTYEDKTTEELQLHFVLVGQQWKLR